MNHTFIVNFHMAGEVRVEASSKTIAESVVRAAIDDGRLKPNTEHLYSIHAKAVEEIPAFSGGLLPEQT